MFSRLHVRLVCALAFAYAAHATQFRPMSIEQIAAHADLVVHGTVISKTCLRDREGRIYTKVELQVADTWKGKHEPTCTIVLSGGTLGEERAAVSGQADYDVGEEVVAFLVRNQRGEGVTVGLAHGKFSVTRDPSGARFVHSAFHGGPAGTKAAGVHLITLDGLKERVHGGAR